MRALAACLMGIVGLGIASMAACSSTSDDTAAGGSSGSSSAGTGATSGSGTTAGSSSGGSGTGEAGAGQGCPGLDANGCGDCFGAMCTDANMACNGDDTCNQAATGFALCACDDASKIPGCADTFNGANDLAKAVVDCAKANCGTQCGL